MADDKPVDDKPAQETIRDIGRKVEERVKADAGGSETATSDIQSKPLPAVERAQSKPERADAAAKDGLA